MTVAGLWGFKIPWQTQAYSFSLPETCASDVSSQLLLQHHACLLPANMLPAMVIMDQSSETVTNLQFISCLHREFIHRNKMVTKTDTVYKDPFNPLLNSLLNSY